MSTDWTAYFDGLAAESPLYAEQAAVFVDSLLGAIDVHADHRVLDFGCGHGLVAVLLAPLVAEVRLWDPSENMRTIAGRNTAELTNVTFCDLSGGPGAAVSEGDLDLIVVNSVVQYMPAEELTAWLRTWTSMLAPRGQVVLSDLVPSDLSRITDVLDLLRIGAGQRSPLGAARRALGGLSRYWWTRRTVPLTRVDQDDLRRRAAAAGLETDVLADNLTHFRGRWTAVLRRPAGP